ncbi:hypothetical protein [Larkinella soli]|uniref:hypothetical protein n=1 Tax=Larkinella soli TaxID=1770527 RepID=UPI000FFBDC38|nr:hypothetical protein [Larkinella soli]
MKKTFIINSAKQLLDSASSNLNITAKNESTTIFQLKAGTGKTVCCEWVPQFLGMKKDGLDQLVLS